MSRDTGVAIAALLHDVGKLYQRAYWHKPPSDLSARHHAAYTAWAIERHAQLLERAGIDAAWLTQTAKRHHNSSSTQPDYRPQSVDEWLVYYADNYASYERLERTTTEREHPTSAPLQPVFADVRLGEQPAPLPGGYDLEPLSAGAPYPRGKGSNVSTDAYLHKLVERLEDRLTALGELQPDADALLYNLLGLLQETCWCVPSDTLGEPGVSLYDHLRLSAAIATALQRYHRDSDSLTPDALHDERPEKFLLVIGDLGGIQEHIYRIRKALTGTGALAKRLRARSLEVSLSSEAFAFSILERVGLPYLQRIMSAGGKFYLLLPNSPSALSAVQDVQSQWETHALSQGATLSPQLAWVPFRPDAFKRFDTILREAHKALGIAKLHPFRSQLGTVVLHETAPRPCAAYGSVPAARDEPGAVSHQAVRDEQVGRRLPREEALSLTRDSDGDYRFPGIGVHLGSTGRHVMRSNLDFTPSERAWETRALLGHLPTVTDAMRALGYGDDVTRYAAWLEQRQLTREEDELSHDRDRPLTFGELAALSAGVPWLGALLLDADRMGEVFERGFSRHGEAITSPSRLAALSRSLEQFFTTEVATLIREPQRYSERLQFGHHGAFKKTHYPLIYTVYAGGDDMFLLGPWNVLLEFALDLNALYRQFTGGHPAFTLSGGFVLTKPHLPVPKIATYVQEAEQQAKDAGRDRLSLFGVTVPWAELKTVRERARALAHRRERNEVPRGLAYRLLSLHRMWERWDRQGDPEGLRYKPNLAYLFRRTELRDQRPFLEPLFDHQGTSMRYLPAWVQWAIYETRGE